MTPKLKRAIMLALLALALAGCDMGNPAPTPLPAVSPATQATASPAQGGSNEQPSPEPPVEGRPASTVPPEGDPPDPVDRIPEEGTVVPQISTQIPVAPVATTEAIATATAATNAEVTSCTPTRPDAEGPFYEPNAPERTSIGKGHVLRGVVRSSADCRPVPGAQIEFWQVNEQAQYDDDHRATMFSDSSGAYSFESNYPLAYSGRPSHIHLRVTAKGYQTLITQFYPQPGETEATFDIVLVEE